MRLERGILGVEVDQSAGCHPPTHLFDPFLQPRREDSAARTDFNRLVPSRLTSGARANSDGSRKASVGSIAPG